MQWCPVSGTGIGISGTNADERDTGVGSSGVELVVEELVMKLVVVWVMM